jgi:hypothetical protein
MSAMPHYNAKAYAGIKLVQQTAQSPHLLIVLCLAAANTMGGARVLALSASWQKTLLEKIMPRMKLTERSIARLAAPTPNGKQIAYWDADLRGFGVLVSGCTTVKSFIVQRDLAGGKTRRVTIASVAELSLSDAREKARPLLVSMRGGLDPKAKPNVATLQETANLYLQSARLSPRSKEIYAAHLRIHLAPLKDRPLSSITPAEIDNLHFVGAVPLSVLRSQPSVQVWVTQETAVRAGSGTASRRAC